MSIHDTCCRDHGCELRQKDCPVLCGEETQWILCKKCAPDSTLETLCTTDITSVPKYVEDRENYPILFFDSREEAKKTMKELDKIYRYYAASCRDIRYKDKFYIQYDIDYPDGGIVTAYTNEMNETGALCIDKKHFVSVPMEMWLDDSDDKEREKICKVAIKKSDEANEKIYADFESFLKSKNVIIEYMEHKGNKRPVIILDKENIDKEDAVNFLRNYLDNWFKF